MLRGINTMSKNEIYVFDGKRLIIEDQELALAINIPFCPVLVPEKRKDKEKLADDHRLRLFRTENKKLYECYVEKEKQKNGQFLLFYPKGQVKMESYYLQGQLHGPSTFFSEKGDLLAKSWFVEGKQQGKVQWFYLNGNAASHQRYFNGAWHGRQDYYYEDAALKSTIHYIHGVLD